MNNLGLKEGNSLVSDKFHCKRYGSFDLEIHNIIQV